MAYYKASLPAIAKWNATGTGTTATVTYSNGDYIGKLISVSTAPTTYDVKLYGDDAVAERVKGVTEVALTINTTTLPLKLTGTLFGATYTDADSSSKTPANAKKKSTDNANYVGFAFCYSEMVDNAEKAYVKFFPKVKFAVPSESFSTQGETITFGTPTLNATAEMDVSSTNNCYEQTFEFTGTTAVTDAVAKLKSLLSITE